MKYVMLFVFGLFSIGYVHAVSFEDNASEGASSQMPHVVLEVGRGNDVTAEVKRDGAFVVLLKHSSIISTSNNSNARFVGDNPNTIAPYVNTLRESLEAVFISPKLEVINNVKLRESTSSHTDEWEYTLKDFPYYRYNQIPLPKTAVLHDGNFIFGGPNHSSASEVDLHSTIYDPRGNFVANAGEFYKVIAQGSEQNANHDAGERTILVAEPGVDRETIEDGIVRKEFKIYKPKSRLNRNRTCVGTVSGGTFETRSPSGQVLFSTTITNDLLVGPMGNSWIGGHTLSVEPFLDEFFAVVDTKVRHYSDIQRNMVVKVFNCAGNVVYQRALEKVTVDSFHTGTNSFVFQIENNIRIQTFDFAGKLSAEKEYDFDRSARILQVVTDKRLILATKIAGAFGPGKDWNPSTEWNVSVVQLP